MAFNYKSWFFCMLLLVVLMSAACDGGGKALPLDERLGAGEVRAGVITKESELLEGPEAHGWIGDYKIYNDRVAFVVQNVDDPHGWGPYGGSLLDADRIRGEGEKGHEALQEIFLNINLMTMRPASCEISSDGRGGQPAVVRLQGRHQSIPTMAAALEGSLKPEELEIVHEYILEPDAEFLRIRTAVRARGGRELGLDVGDMVISGDFTTDFVPGTLVSGTGLPSGEHYYLAGFNPDVCYLYAGTQQGITTTFSLEEVSVLSVNEGTAPTVRSDEDPLVTQRILLVGGGGLDACLRILHGLDGEINLGRLGGSVADDSGEPVASAFVLAQDVSLPEDRNLVGQTYTDEQGAFEMELPAGEYRISVSAEGDRIFQSDVVGLTPGQTGALDAVLPRPALLHYRCDGRDREGSQTGPLPCKITLQAGHDADMLAPVSTGLIHYGVAGEGEYVIPAGDWTVTLSRGWEYTIHRENVSARAGQLSEVAGVLQRQVDTTGFVACDFHSHCTRSIDSIYAMEDKLGSNICEGVELLVGTDHDAQVDYAPVLREMEQRLSVDTGSLIRTVVGNEISALYGHCTVFPLPAHPTGRVYWQFPYTLYEDGVFVRQLEYPEIWPRARETGARIINVAHPVTFAPYLRHVGFDPPEVIPRLEDLDPELFSTDFDTIELLNGLDDDHVMLELVLPIWCSFNNQGLFKTAIGVSDSHSRGTEAGFGRTMVASLADTPADIDLDEIWTNLKNRRAMVGGGIFVRIRIGEATVGDLVTAGGSLDVHLHVEAAEWVPVEQVALIANGETVETTFLKEPGQVDPSHPAVRFDGTLAVNPTRDTWYAAVATGAEADRLDPVFVGYRPVGMTNAIQVDVDGNGRFDPPD